MRDLDLKDLIETAHQGAVDWARELLERDLNSWAILDTETTGLGDHAEVVQIGVIDDAGNVLLDNVLVKPVRPIPPDATAIHHITNEMVANAPAFPDALPLLRSALEGKLLVIYNAQYDLRLLAQSARARNIDLQLGIQGFTCAMLEYADWVGDWNDYHGNFRWQKLEGGDHSALGDCRATLDVIKRMAAV
jgi:DNA polymerase-3 subunit epsilon